MVAEARSARVLVFVAFCDFVGSLLAELRGLTFRFQTEIFR